MCHQLNRAKGSRGGLRPFSSAPCGVQRQSLWWGLGQRPNCYTVNPTMLNALNPAALAAGSEASLRSNFARPQTRPQAALSAKISWSLPIIPHSELKNRLPTPITA